MSRGLVAILLGFGAIVSALAGFFLTGKTSVGAMVFSFLSPALALVGIILSAMEMSSAGERGESSGTGIAALVLNLLAFIFGLLIAITCGLCNACASASQGMQSGQGDFGSFNDQLNKAMREGAEQQARRAEELRRRSGADDMARSAEAVRVLGDRCATAWCAGPFDYQFSGLTCTADCELSFTATREGSVPATTSVRIARAAAEPPPEGGFSPEFFDAVTAALSEWERQQPTP